MTRMTTKEDKKTKMKDDEKEKPKEDKNKEKAQRRQMTTKLMQRSRLIKAR